MKVELEESGLLMEGILEDPRVALWRALALQVPLPLCVPEALADAVPRRSSAAAPPVMLMLLVALPL